MYPWVQNLLKDIWTFLFKTYKHQFTFIKKTTIGPEIETEFGKTFIIHIASNLSNKSKISQIFYARNMIKLIYNYKFWFLTI